MNDNILAPFIIVSFTFGLFVAAMVSRAVDSSNPRSMENVLDRARSYCQIRNSDDEAMPLTITIYNTGDIESVRCPNL